MRRLLWSLALAAFAFAVAAVRAHGQVMPDAAHLSWVAAAEGVPPVVLQAVKWTESQGSLNGRLRAHACRPKPFEAWKTCAWGPLQVKLATARRYCDSLISWRVLTTYENNVRCGAKILRALWDRCGDWNCAIRLYYSESEDPAAERYRRDVASFIGTQALQHVDP